MDDPVPVTILGCPSGGCAPSSRREHPNMDPLDVLEQQFVLLIAGRRSSFIPFVVAGARYSVNSAGHRDINTVVGEFMNQPERYFGRIFSFAK
jgi:hypothetical protein